MTIKRRKIFAYFLIALNFALLGILVFTFLNIRKKVGNLNDIKREIVQMEIEEAKIWSIKPLFDEIEDSINKVDSIFIRREEVINLLEGFENISDESGVDLEIISANIPEKNNDSALFKMTVEGKFNDIMHFIFFLESMKYQISFEEVFFGKNRIGSSEWRADIEIKLLTYI